VELSILIPARNEMFLGKTVENILENIEAETEIIVVCDGDWPDPAIEDNPRVHLIHHAISIGQRAATNEAAKLSRAEFILKCDAHCAFDKGFDKKLMEDCEYDWTITPRLYNLHAFDWGCKKCGNRVYQGPYPKKCDKCANTTDFERVMVWKPRFNRMSDFYRFDKDLHFQYWSHFKKRPEAQGDLVPTMSMLGACWMMHRKRYWELDGMDEAHGSWGQMGTEISCKTWLSGGKQFTNRKTWYSHLFRTQEGFGFPYPNPGIGKARNRSRKLWLENTWPKAKHPLSWLIEKFAPVPDWEQKGGDVNVGNIKSNDFGRDNLSSNIGDNKVDGRKTKKAEILNIGFLYYTDNRLDEKIMKPCQNQIMKCANGHEIVSVSLKPIEFGKNIVLPLQRGYLTMFKEILAGLEASTADIIFFVEHDVIYHPSHFDFIPSEEDVFFYDQNKWMLNYQTGHALFYHSMSTSMMCAYREVLLKHYRKRVERVEKEGYSYRMGFEPGGHRPPRGVDDYIRKVYFSPFPCIDVRHSKNLTPSRWTQDEFRNKRNLHSWTEAEEIPFWGRTKGCVEDLFRRIA
jgi:glycosyltransferase involved in cell wall biosynthesis